MSDPVPSPCVQKCRLSPYTGLCLGCFRTGNEIACWITMPDAVKREVWARLAERRGEAPTNI